VPSSDEVHPTGNSTGGTALGAFTYAVSVPVPNVGTAAGSNQQALFGDEAYFYATCAATDALGAAVYANTTLAYVSTADASNLMPVVGFIVSKASSTACTVQRYGESSLVFAGLETGKRYFLASSGGITTPPFPGDSVEFVQQVGTAISSNKLFIQPTGTVIRRDLNGDDEVVCCSSLLPSTGVPPASLGKDGDFCIDSVATRLYGPKVKGTWGDGVTLVGAQGAPGMPGAQGNAGAMGDRGQAGCTIVNGEGPPRTDYGVEGDFYYATDLTTFYGPKTGNTWPATGVQMRGQDGTRWYQGEGPPAADNDYPDGSYYFDSVNQKIYPPAS
jgi:hypothetical protein